MKKVIEQVIEIENQAQALNEEAVRQAEKLPFEAQHEADILLENVRNESEREAKQRIEDAQAEDEVSHILAQAEEQAKRTKSIASQYMELAVNYVIEQVIGRKEKDGR